ncbi:MAG: hypothetical protein A3I66_12100 [Burkholderiales bacterium RIFCSPLOWO2_02_FULL_57_36]|nr:MAG: hypothetical protein A3I66_12100 [Burkholderiales bacterium RIFCSPLOWO2_02_FULL_57_36]
MGAMAGVAAQAAMSAQNQMAAIATAKIKADEARTMALVNSFMAGVAELATINKEFNQIARQAI